MSSFTFRDLVNSLLNPARAKDDLLTTTASGSAINEDTTGLIYLDVMANDGSDKTKSLWAVDDGVSRITGTRWLAELDLLIPDFANFGNCVTDKSANGARISITSNGQVAYDSSTLSAAFKSNLQKLGAGESITDTFTYSIISLAGGITWATATVKFAGVNDAVNITSGLQTGSVTEDAHLTPSTTDTVSSTGTISFSDADLSDVHTASVSASSSNTTSLGFLTLSPVVEAPNAATGSVAWNYTLNSAATNYLKQGEVVTETYSVQISDGKGSVATQLITVRITGTNDIATVSSDAKSVTEANVASALNTSGVLTVTDADSGEAKVVAQTNTHGTYGDFSINANGNWTYVGNGAHNELFAGQVVTETFTVTSLDGTATGRVVITITGTNDAPVITSTAQAGAVKEDDTLTATGQITSSDVDNGATATYSGSATSTYGSFTVTTAGAWTYTLDNAAHQNLAAGETHQEVFTVTVTDDKGATATQDVTITITGTNDAPVITSTAQAGAVKEDDTLTATGQITSSDVDNGATATYSGNATGTYGSFAVTAAGAWTYTLDNAAHQNLAAGETHQEVFTVTVTDDQGSTATQDVTITITGTNDAPVITSTAQAGAVKEDDTLTATGQITSSDVDNGATATYSGSATSTYGSFTVTTAGAWTYTLDNAAHQNLAAGETHQEVFTVTVTDDQGSTATQDVTITITGTNDAPVITSQAQAGAVKEDDTLTATGQITSSDVDNGATATYSGSATSTYGSFTVTTAGAWTYTLDNAAHQNLAAGETHQEVFTVTVTDDQGATATQDVTITITGTNDAPVITSSAQAGAVKEDDTLTATGQITSSDVDNGATATYSGSATSTYGSFTVTTAGAWTYTLDNAAHQNLAAGETHQEVFTVTVTDDKGATATQDVTITITGTNDAPVITSTAQAGAVKEDDTLTATGQITSSDVDNGATATYSGSATSTYGSFTVTTAGAWTYTLDNAAHQNLAAGETHQEVFTVTVTDDKGATATQDVTITITGTNDAPVITSTAQAGAVKEDDTLTATGQITSSDVDNGATATYSGSATSTYGSFTVTTAGAWTYTLDNAAHQNLAAGETHQEVFTVTVTDDKGATATQDVTITITGTNDAPVITSTAQAGAVKEDDTLTATGQITSSDVDNGATATYSGSATSTYGSFTVTTAGAWTYTLDNAAHQNLAAGETHQEVFTVTVTDDQGSTATQDVTITITGTNDAPVITSTAQAGAVKEDDTLTATGQITSSDVDNGATATYSGSATSTYGSFTVTTAGAWTYTLDNAAHQNLAAGETHQEVFTVTVTDDQGSTATQDVTITITGTNDAPVITSQAQAGAVKEDDTLTATGQITSSDVDNGATATYSGSATSTYGSFTVTTAGAWTYTLDNAAHQNLAAGETHQEVFTVTVTDDKGATATQDVTITITGTNDAPVITSTAQAGAVKEDDTLTATGQITSSDVDNGATATYSGSATSTYGSFTVTTAGAWTYTLDNAAHQNLAAGETHQEVFTVTVTDDKGATATQDVTITITGTNDAPVITSTAQAGAVKEDDTLTATGQITSSDVDNGATATYSGSATSTYGSFTVTTAGAWTYTLDNAAHQNLAAGETHQEVFTVTVTDDQGATATQDVTITITGTNDAPVITSTAQAGAVKEDDTLTATGQITSSDVDNGATATYSGNATGTYGSFTVTTAGAWTYTLDNAAHQNLAAGETHQEVFTVTVTDDQGSTATQDVTITITGTNDAPVITSQAQAGAVKEDDTLTATGQITSSDVDNGATATYSGSATSTYGSFTVTTAGAWTYTLDNAAHQNLAAGETHQEVFTVTVTDDKGATATQDVTITITGTNDAPVITSQAQAGAVKEDDTLTATGQITSSDVDNGATATYSGSATSTYGSFTVTTAGAWTYTLDNAAHQNLAAGETHQEVFTVTVTDDQGATATQDVTITITGTNDAPVITSGTTANVDENAAISTVVYSATATDVDAGDSVTWSLSGADANLLTIDSNGDVRLINSADYEAKTTYSFNVVATDTQNVSTTKAVTLAINDVYENQAPTAVVLNNVVTSTPENGGQVKVADIAVTDDAFGTNVLSLSGTDAASFTIIGNELYFTGGANFEAKTSYNVSVNVDDVDLGPNPDASTSFTLNISNVNEAPVAVADSNVSDAVVEAGNLVAGDATAIGNVLTNDTDVDAGDTKTVTTTGTFTGTYGSLVLNANGSYTYTLNNADADTNALAKDQAASEVFNYTMRDTAGLTSNATLTINITGTNDAPALTGTKATLVAGTEDTAYTVTAASLLQGYTDAEGDNFSVSNLTASAGTLVDNGNGTYTITPAANTNGIVTLGYSIVDSNAAIASTVDNMVQLEAIDRTNATDQTPQITAVGSSGEYVVTFNGVDSRGDTSIFVQKFNADGIPASAMVKLEAINRPFGADITPQVSAVGSNGEYVVTFNGVDSAGDQSIFVQKFNANGTVAGSMVQLEAIGYTAGADQNPQVTAVGSSGEYVVTFQGIDSAVTGNTDSSIYVQKFNANGTVAGAMVQLEAIGRTNSTDQTPQITAVGSNGEYVVTFNGVDSAGDSSIFVQKFNANGTVAGSMVQLEAIGYTAGADITPQVKAVGSNGEYVVTFQGTDSAGDSSIFVQKFNANGTVAGSMVQLEAIGYTAGADQNPQVTAVGSSGEYVVTFQGIDSAVTGNTDFSIYVQKFNANGTVAGAMVQLEAIGRTSSTDQTPQITAVGSNGEYVVTFNGVDSAGDQSIFVQKFNADGTVAGSMVQLEAIGRTNSTDQTPQITAVGSSGQYVVTFNGIDSAGDTSIFVQKFNADGTVIGNTLTQSYTLAAVNDAPVTTVPASYTTNEDTQIRLSGLSVTDLDADDKQIFVNLSIPAGSGTLTAVSDTTVTVTTISSTNLTLIGTVSDINRYLDASSASVQLRYTPALNFNGAVTLTMTTNDQGNTGAGGALTDVDTSVINITPVNDAPTLTGTRASLVAGNEDVAYNVTSASLLQGYTDVDGDTLSVSNLTVNNGTVVNNSDGTYTITPTADFNGTVILNYSVIDGNGGTVATTQAYSLAAVNDAPINTVPASYTTNEDTAVKLTGLSVADVDVATGTITVNLAVGSGTLTATAAGSVTVTGSGTSSLTLTGTLANINAYLANATNQPTYTPVANANGAVTLTMTTNDGGNTGSGGALTDVDTTNINITPVNDVPTFTGIKASLVAGTEDATYTVTAADLLQGYTDVDGDTLNVSNLTASNGTVVNNGDGTYTITPTANFNGTVNLTYQVVDPSGAVAITPYNMVQLEATGNTSGFDTDPQITAVGNSGEYVVTFQGIDSNAAGGDASIYVQKFYADGTPAGSMVQLEAIDNGVGNEFTPEVTAVGSNGEYVVTFRGTEAGGTDNSIYVQKFNADGTPAGSMVKLEATGNTAGSDLNPEVTAVGSSGEYVVTFYGQEAGNAETSVYLQKFNSNGTLAGSLVQLEAIANTTGSDLLPQVTALGGSGEYVVTFYGQDAGNTDLSIYVQKFNADGTPAGSMVQLEAIGNTTGSDFKPQVTAVGSSGEYVVTFEGYEPGNNELSVYVQKFNANGTLAGAMVKLEAIGNTTGTDQAPQVAAVGSAGNYVVTFYGQDDASAETSVFVQKFNADGTVAGAMVLLEATGNTFGTDKNPQVTAVGSSGEYVVTFEGYEPSATGGDSNIYVQKFNADGTVAGAMLKLEATGNTAGTDQLPQVSAVGSSGGYVVTFNGVDTGNADSSVYVQKFNADGTITGNTVKQSYSLAAVNDAPINTVPASYTTNEDTAVKLTGLSVADVDVATGTITVNLAVGSGTLTATAAGSVTVAGSGTSSLTLTGTLANINAYLANATNQPTYTPVADANGEVTLTMTTNDGGNTGSGGALTDVDTITINITPVNDAPALTAAKATLVAGTEDTAYTVTVASLLQGYTDAEGDILSVVNLTASNGTVVNNGDGTYTITPTANFNGTINLTYQVVDPSGATAKIPYNMVQLEATGNTTGADDTSQVTAVGSSGEYVVTFVGYEAGNTDSSIYVQKFNADGTKAGSMVQLEATGNTAGNDQSPQLTVVSSSGEYVVTFTGSDAGNTDSSIYVQKFNADGTPAGSMVKLEATGNTAGADYNSQITAVGSSGEYVVTFQGTDAGNTDSSIYVQKFNANGTPAGSMVQLEATGITTGNDIAPQVTAVGSSGEYVVTFYGVDAGSTDYSIYVQKFNANGTPAGSMVQLEATGNTTGSESIPQVTAVGSSGEYVVTFQGTDAGNTDSSIYVQKFNANGTPAGSLVQLEATGNTTGSDQTPQVTAVGSSGDYVVTFYGVDSSAAGGDNSVYVQKFNANGTPAGSIVQLEATGKTTGLDYNPQITAVGSSGEYVVTFIGTDANADYSVYVQKFNADGTKAGAMVQLEAIGNASGFDFDPQVTSVGSSGDYVVTFYGADAGNADNSVYVQKFNADGTLFGNTIYQSYTLAAVNDAPVGPTDLVTNGGFDSIGATTNVSFNNGVVSSSAAPGWTYTQGGALGLVTALPPNAYGSTGTGNILAFGGGETSSGQYATQTINTVAGTQYTLSFKYGAFTSGTGFAQSLEVTATNTATGTSLLTQTVTDTSPTAPAVLDNYTYTFVATGSQTTLKFKDVSTQTGGTDALLDSISVLPSLTTNGVEDNVYNVTVASLLAGYSDVDGDTLTVSNLTASNGTVVNNGNGSYTITPTPNFNGVVTLNYTVSDGTASIAATKAYSVSAVNDAPVASNDTASAIEASGTNNGTAGTNATGNVLTNDTDIDASTSFAVTSIRTGAVEGAGTTGSLGNSLAGTYGTLTLGSNGAYTYTVNNANTSVNALKSGQSLVDSFNYTMSDGTLSDTAVLNVTINGANDAPTVSVVPSLYDTQAQGAWIAFLQANGVYKTASSNSATAGTYSFIKELTLSADATYTFNLSADNLAVVKVDGVQIITSNSFTSVNTATATLTAGKHVIEITHTNLGSDPAGVGLTISNGATVVWDTRSNKDGNLVWEDHAAYTVASGQLEATDVDSAQAFTWSMVNQTGTYGTMTVDATGKWTYVLNNSASNVQSLNAGQIVTDTFAVKVTDAEGAFTTQNVSVKVAGDGAAGETSVAKVGLYSANGHVYEFVSGSYTNAQAETLAASKGGYLATITSAAENTFLTTFLAGNQAWISGSDAVTEGAWKWTSGPENGNAIGGANYSNWIPSQPDDYLSNEDFLQITGNGQWNDVSANATMGVLIEYGA